jgi:adenylate cyclase
MDAMTRVILEGGGVVDKFAGDGITAIWGVPVPRRTDEEVRMDAIKAIRTALRMRSELSRVNAELKRRRFPEIRMAVGLDAGEVIGCCIGTSRRQQYTTVGDTTNTAARLVTVAKTLMKSPASEEACTIVLGGPIVDLIGAEFSLSPLGDHLVKGKRNPVTCYRLNGESVDRAVPEINLRSGERPTASTARLGSPRLTDLLVANPPRLPEERG